MFQTTETPDCVWLTAPKVGAAAFGRRFEWWIMEVFLSYSSVFWLTEPSVGWSRWWLLQLLNDPKLQGHDFQKALQDEMTL